MLSQKVIFYLTTAKIGLHAFTFSELNLLKKREIPFILGLVQLNRGPFMPKNEWPTLVFRRSSLAYSVLITFLLNPLIFLRLLKDSLKDHQLLYLLIAGSFYILLRKKGVVNVHVQMGDHKLFIGYYLSKLLRVNLTTTIHAHELYQPLAYSNKTILRKAFNSCSDIITISEYNKQILVDFFGIDSQKIQIMYLYPSNFDKNDQKYRSKILFVASWIRKKGCAELLMALSEIRILRDDFTLWFVGSDIMSNDESVNVPELIRNYHLEGNVVLLGMQPKSVMHILFEYCDIFCLPSVTDYYPDGNVREREGIPVAIMEAMSWGKPVIATMHAGIPELVDEYLVEERDVTKLKETILFLLDNPQKGIESGEENRKRLHKKFNSDNVEIIQNLFNRFLNRG